MEVLVNSDGTRNREYRPYIDQEESRRSLNLYNPYVPLHYGLYDTTQPPCESFQTNYWQMRPLWGRPGPAVIPIGNLQNQYAYVSRANLIPSGYGY